MTLIMLSEDFGQVKSSLDSHTPIFCLECKLDIPALRDRGKLKEIAGHDDL